MTSSAAEMHFECDTRALSDTTHVTQRPTLVAAGLIPHYFFYPLLYPYPFWVEIRWMTHHQNG